MPIDMDAARNAPPRVEEVSWSSSDVLLYHLALGAGGDPSDPAELAWATEAGSAVLPTFPVVAPTLRVTTPIVPDFPGIDVDLRAILHASQRVEVHAPIPRDGSATLSTRVAGLYDKGSAAIVVLDTDATDPEGAPLWTSSMRMFVRGEGGFGGDRGPAGPADPPDRDPDHVLVTPTMPQQALWYRLLGDRNPLHDDPSMAAKAGFPRPILHGLCTYGMVCRSLVDAVLGGAVDRVAAVEVRFNGIVFPGEALRTSAWLTDDRILFTTSVDGRGDATALTGGEIVVRDAVDAP